MSLSRNHIHSLQQSVLTWFASSPRKLWWREDKQDPWVTLVTEVMSQQTQMERVAEAAEKFLQKYPSPQDLAQETTAGVVRAWRGLGYNNRAIRLRECAVQLAQLGKFPSNYQELVALPGVGDYTASALLSFCFELDNPVVDVNVSRVLSRVAAALSYTDEKLSSEQIREMAVALVPSGRGRAWHQGLMDIGSLFCRARSTDCDSCPLLSCASRNRLTFRKAAVKKERSYYGKPRRLWRGAIVEVLRDSSVAYSVERIAQSVGLSGPEQTEFIVETLQLLVRDGIVSAAGAQQSHMRYRLKE